jgi:ABC-type xylose transport system substrate-binding protein
MCAAAAAFAGLNVTINNKTLPSVMVASAASRLPQLVAAALSMAVKDVGVDKWMEDNNSTLVLQLAVLNSTKVCSVQGMLLWKFVMEHQAAQHSST